jgi:hypothetical protein
MVQPRVGSSRGGDAASTSAGATASDLLVWDAASLDQVQEQLKLVHGLTHGQGPAEEVGDLHGVAMGCDRLDLQGTGELKLALAMFGVLVQQVIEDAAGGGAALIGEVGPVLAEMRGPLPSRAQGALEGEVTEQVQGTSV